MSSFANAAITSTSLQKVVQDELPSGFHMAKDARVALSKVASLFVLMMSSVSSDVARSEGRSVVHRTDLEQALREINLEVLLDEIENHTTTSTTNNNNNNNNQNRKVPAVKKKEQDQEQPRPKKPRSGYMRFAAEIRPRLMKENPGFRATELAKLTGVEWAKLTDEQKQSYKSTSGDNTESVVID
eukprot:PhM_4_TR2461/c1_g1_i1/m.15295